MQKKTSFDDLLKYENESIKINGVIYFVSKIKKLSSGRAMVITNKKTFSLFENEIEGFINSIDRVVVTSEGQKVKSEIFLIEEISFTVEDLQEEIKKLIAVTCGVEFRISCNEFNWNLYIVRSKINISGTLKDCLTILYAEIISSRELTTDFRYINKGKMYTYYPKSTR